MARRLLLAAGIVAAISLSGTGAVAVEFTEVQSGVSGLDYVGETWGASWGDFNGDRYPDIFSSNHRDRPSVWRNNGDGTFTDIVLQFDTSYTWIDFPFLDTHGGAWGDFDNNGVQDLMVLTGVNFPAELFVNDGTGVAVDETVLRNVPNDFEGRTATWFDYDNDGLLDMIINNRAPNIFLGQDASNTFSDITSTVGLNSFRTNYSLLSDFDVDDTVEIMAVADGDFPEKVYKSDTVPFLDITANFPTSGLVTDAAVGDFNNDLIPDILLVRGNLRPNQSLKVTDNPVGEVDKIEAWMAGGASSGERGMTFTANGPITVTISTQLGLPKFNVGSGGYSPISKTFTLDPTLATDQGIAPHDITIDQGIYIGYNIATSEWEFFMSPGGTSTRAYYEIEGVDLSDPVDTNLQTGDGVITPKLFMNDGVNFTDTNGIGLSVPISCVSTVVGDFDNDMDLDIYMVCRNGIENTANKLYVNQGNATFIEATSHGAEGIIGSGLGSGAGVGENVVTADYDLDGWLDLYVTNGLLMNPIRVGGPDQLLRNTFGNTSTNRWIELDMVGTVSNRDAVGAKVIVTSGGVTQLRERGGSYHRWSQNHSRIHVGLGQNDFADIDIVWPNGETDSFTAVAANGLYEVTQGTLGNNTGSIAAVSGTSYPAFPAAQPGDECGVNPLDQPVDFPYHFDSELDLALFVWKDCVTDEWFVRGTGGGGSGRIYDGKLISNDLFSGVTGFSLESNDVLDASIPGEVDFFLKMSNAGVDGLDFTHSGEICLDVTELPLGGEVLLGRTHIAVSAPINLTTMEPCIDVAPEDITVNEGDGTVSMTVSLSSVSGSTVTVDYTLVSGTALAGSDFTAAAGTLTFAPGETSKTINMTIIEDTLFEDTESYTVELSNASGAFIFDSQATVTIDDNESCVECGQPVIDRFTEQGIFLWKDFQTGVWHVEATAGGDPAGVFYTGLISSTAAFASVVEDGIEASDTLDYTTNPSNIDYVLKIWNTGEDAFQFTPDANAITCFTPTGPSGFPVFVGSTKSAISGAFNLDTLGACLDITVSDIAVSEGAVAASFQVDLSAVSTETVTVDYVTQAGTATGDIDYVAVTAPQTLVFAPGETSKPVDISLIQDTLDEGDETFSLQLSNPTNATLSAVSATATIQDDEVNACGAPTFDAATEQALFIWKDCTTGDWFLRNTAGGDAGGAFFEGEITADSGFESVSGFSIENADTLDYTTDPNVIDFLLKVWNNGEDGIDFKPVVEAGTCLNLTGPSGVPILAGETKLPVSSPVDLGTLGTCTTINVDMTIDDVIVNEADAQASLTVSLSVASGDVITVDYVTLGDTATGDEDYTEVTVPTAVTFNPGVTSQQIVVPILQDNLAEGTESFTVELSGATNATLLDASGLVTITDDEIDPCGMPTYNSATDQNAYLWRDCASGTWHFAATAGGAVSRVTYSGDFTSDAAITGVVGNSIETNDTLDGNVDPLVLDFNLFMKNTGFDGFEFTVGPVSNTCLTVAASSPGAGNVLVGAAQTPLTTPVDLATLQACQ